MRLIVVQCVLVTLAYGLEFEPQPDSRSILIYYRSSLESTSFHLRNRLDSFLAPYTKARSDDGRVIQCSNGVPPEEGSNKACDVDVSHWGGCASSNGYNYNSAYEGPCIFLKLKKDSDWIPEYYTSSTAPIDMPDYIKDQIRRIEQDYDSGSYRDRLLNVVWVSCGGENVVDKENIGSINYYPRMNFDGRYFPVRNEDRYLSPLVAVHFVKPERGIIMFIQCKAWARNLEDEVVHFGLLVDH